MKLEPGPEDKLFGILAKDYPLQVESFLMDIARKAFEVRALQKEFFKHRSSDILTQSKTAERELDRLLNEPAQGGLF